MNTVSFTYTQTGAEPIGVDDIKNYLRIDQTADDDLVASLIAATRSVAEGYLNKTIVQKTVVMTLDNFPSLGVKLLYGPIQSVTAIQYVDSAGTVQTWDTGNYIVDTAGGRAVWAPGAVLPTSLQVIANTKITYVAGYGEATDVSGIPQGIVQALRHFIAACYESREVPSDVPPMICALLQPFRKYVL